MRSSRAREQLNNFRIDRYQYRSHLIAIAWSVLRFPAYVRSDPCFFLRGDTPENTDECGIIGAHPEA
jgi:hypothetical protein